MELALKLLGLFVFIYVFMTVLDLWSIFIPVRRSNGALFRGLPDYTRIHLWYAIYPVKTPNGWKWLKYVKRKQENNGGTCSETSQCWWIFY